MRVSVIVPSYNKALYLRRALDSIASQTLADFEVIVVDDGSSDGSTELAAAYPDPRFRTIKQANAGPGAARNRGLAEARGPITAFLDADDYWRPMYLETGVGVLESCPEAATFTCGSSEEPGGHSTEALWRARGIGQGLQRVTPRTSAKLLTHMSSYMHTCSTMIRTQAARKWGGFYDRNGCRFGEDTVLWLKVLVNDAVSFELAPLAVIDRGASALSGNYKGARPVEPFLADPEELAAVCPPELAGVLRSFYALRACKTAAVLGYWGQSRQARRLLGRFVSARDWRQPFFAAALLACTPLGGLAGRLVRAVALRHTTSV